MRIALFSDYYPPHLGGGVERVVAELAAGLTRHGHDIRVFTLNTCRAPAFEAVEEDLRVFRAGAVQLTGLLRLQSCVSPQLFALAQRELRSEPADLIHAHNRFFFSSLVAAGLSRLLHVPLVTTLHLGSLDHLPARCRLPVLAYERTLGRAIIGQSQRLIAVSKAVAAYATTRLGARPERLRIAPNGVDARKFRPRPGNTETEGLRVAFVGRLIQNKGPQYLLEAAPALLVSHPRAAVDFIGDGPLLADLQRRARELGVAANVRFLGARDDVHELLPDYDVFVRPSLMEGMPLTVLEAMACALPVVATPVGGTAEVVRQGETGLLVPAANVGALGMALQRLAADPALRRRLGRNGRRLVEAEHSWDRVVEANIEVYEEVVGGRRPVAARAA